MLLSPVCVRLYACWFLSLSVCQQDYEKKKNNNHNISGNICANDIFDDMTEYFKILYYSFKGYTIAMKLVL